MSSLDDNEIQKITAHLGAEFQRHFQACCEETEARDRVVQENFDAIVAKQIAPLKKSVANLIERTTNLEVSVRATNRELRQLDTAVGNAEHKVHALHLATDKSTQLDPRIVRVVDDLVPPHTYPYGSNCSEIAPEHLASLHRNYGYASDLSQTLWPISEQLSGRRFRCGKALERRITLLEVNAAV
jgi:hypothetical protein